MNKNKIRIKKCEENLSFICTHKKRVTEVIGSKLI